MFVFLLFVCIIFFFICLSFCYCMFCWFKRLVLLLLHIFDRLYHICYAKNGFVVQCKVWVFAFNFDGDISTWIFWNLWNLKLTAQHMCRVNDTTQIPQRYQHKSKLKFIKNLKIYICFLYTFGVCVYLEVYRVNFSMWLLLVTKSWLS